MTDLAWTIETEERTLAFLVQSKDQHSLFEIIPEGFFQAEECQDLFKFLKDSWSAHGQIPTEAESRSHLMGVWTKHPLTERTARLTMVSRIYRKIQVTKATLEELKKSIIREVIVQSLTEAATSENPLDVVVSVRQKIDGLHAAINNAGAKTTYPLAPEYLAQREKDILENPNQFIKLGMPKLDAAAGGGHMRGEFILVAATINTGKTFVLVNLTYNLLLQGYKVLYVNMDLPPKRLEARLYTRMTGYPANEDTSLKVLHNGVRAWSEQHNVDPLSYACENLQPDSITPSGLRGLVQKVDDKSGPRDVILIDYLGQVLPDVRGERQDISLKNVAEGLRGLGRDMTVEKLVIAATQTNYNDWDPDKERTTTIKNLGDSKAQARACQFGFAIDQTRAERKHFPPLVRTNVFKVSNGGESGITIPCVMDYKHALFMEATNEIHSTYSSNGNGKMTVTPIIGNNKYAITGAKEPGGDW